MATPVHTDKNNGRTDRSTERSTEPRPWDPLAEARTVLSQLSRFPDSWSELLAPVRDGFIPLADVEETDDAYVIEVELPGIDRRDVDISIAGRRLTITGERKDKERVGIVRRRTRSVGRFEYDIQLPGDVDEKDATASMADGVLTIRIPKATTERARRIAVK
jgi:HSP20 family protein